MAHNERLLINARRMAKYLLNLRADCNAALLILLLTLFAARFRFVPSELHFVRLLQIPMASVYDPATVFTAKYKTAMDGLH